jgi:DNA repair exonuclease SbcCD ATPase subunit
MSTSEAAKLQQLDAQIARAHRRAWLRTSVLSAATVLVALGFLLFTWQELKGANEKLTSVNELIRQADTARQAAETKLKNADAARVDAERKLAAADAARLDAEAKLKAAQDALTAANEQVARLRQQLGEIENQLKQALDLEKHVYKLDWTELKMMAGKNGRAVDLLSAIESMKDRVHWGTGNSEAGGYTSPEFATLILRRFGKDFSNLPRSTEPPAPGDVVLYPAGYALFYFRDHLDRPFVVGMTPFGVLALNEDFARSTSVLRTGLNNR